MVAAVARSILTTAMSLLGSLPTIRPLNSRLSGNVTVTVLAQSPRGYWSGHSLRRNDHARSLPAAAPFSRFHRGAESARSGGAKRRTEKFFRPPARVGESDTCSAAARGDVDDGRRHGSSPHLRSRLKVKSRTSGGTLFDNRRWIRGVRGCERGITPHKGCAKNGDAGKGAYGLRWSIHGFLLLEDMGMGVRDAVCI